MPSQDRRVVGTAAAAHATVHAHELSIPILITVWLAEYGVTPALLGVVATIAYGCFGAGALPAGVLADRVGAGRLIGFSLLGSGAAFALVGVAGWLPVADAGLVGVPAAIWAIALALGLWGLAASAYHPAGLSMLSTDVERRGRGLALHGAAGNVGIALGPLATILLLVVLPWPAVAVLLGVAGVLIGLAAIVLDVGSRPEPDASPPSIRSELADVRGVLVGPFLVVLAVVVCSGLFYRGVLTFLPEILADLAWLEAITLGGRELPASRLAYVGILGVGVAGQLAGGRLSDVVPPLRGLAASFLALAVLALSFPLAAEAGAAPLLVVAALLGAGLFVVQPLYQAAVADHTPTAARGRSYGVTYLCVFGIGALGGALAGGLLTVASAGALFVGLAAIAGLAALLAGGLVTTRLLGA